MIKFRTFVSRLTTSLVALIPMLVLVGWLINNPILTRVFPQFTPMNPVTAALFILAAVCLFTIQKTEAEERKYIYVISGSLMLLVGGAMLLKYGGGKDFFIDRILFESKLGINRMAFATALNFVLLGIIFLVYPTKRLISCICKLSLLAVSLYSLVAYMYNFIGVYGKAIHNPIAIHTAFVFMLISLYLLIHDKWWNARVIVWLHSKNLLIPAILTFIFAITMTIAGGVSILVDSNLKKQAELRFQNQTDQITSFIQSRMNLYVGVTYGLQGLFAASENVEQSEWNAYIDEINVPTHYSGISGISYAPKTTPEMATRLPFKIYPSTVKDIYYPLTYIATFVAGSSTAAGFDVSSEVNRNAALNKAIDTDMPSATPVVLAATTRVPVFSVYVPVYSHATGHITKEDRQNSVQGVISVSFRLEKIFPDLFTNNPLIDNKIDVEIFDSPSSTSMSTSSLLYDTSIASIHKSDEELTGTSKIQVADRIWTIKYVSDPSVYLPFLEKSGQGLVLVLGFIFSMLITMFASMYIRSREQALLSKNIQLEALVQSFPYGVLIEDDERNMILGNTKTMQLFGIEGKVPDFVGVPVMEGLELIRPLIKDFDSYKKRDIEIASKHEVVADEKVELTNGTYISRSYIPLYYQNKMHGAMWLYKDITEEEQIDRMKTEFVSLASHQLRTPLTSIKWYTELLSDEETQGKMNKEQKSYIKEIGDASDRMVGLVGSLLNVSRLELGTFAIEPEKANLLDVVGVAVKEAEPNFLLKKQNLTYTHPDKMTPIMIDIKVTHIIVQNLLSNACKYTPEGGSINLSIKKTIAKNGVPGAIQISCSDTGYGIPQAQQGSVFKKLFRADNVRVLDVEGTGLGLYIIKTVVEAAGCTISFTSEENKGTTFTITMPTTGMVTRSGKKSLSESME
ncbi:MAG: CHASE domain-containing protein [Patescibacteria group bacterium]